MTAVSQKREAEELSILGRALGQTTLCAVAAMVAMANLGFGSPSPRVLGLRAYIVAAVVAGFTIFALATSRPGGRRLLVSRTSQVASVLALVVPLVFLIP